MKKVLTVLGGIFLCVLVAGGVIFAVLAFSGSRLDKESKAYVDEVVPKICGDLKMNTLMNFAAPNLVNSPKADMEKVFTLYNKLGKFIKFNESTGQANISYTTQNGKVVTARYSAKVDFETGPARIDIGLIKEKDAWKIMSFYINSSSFLQ